jgi:hypothetical protein
MFFKLMLKEKMKINPNGGLKKVDESVLVKVEVLLDPFRCFGELLFQAHY